MLTVKDLQDMNPNEVIATGTSNDDPKGLFMANTNRQLRWVAVRGGGYWDWTIYCHTADHDVEWIKRHGDKVYDPRHIRMLVECDDDVFALYRF